MKARFCGVLPVLCTLAFSLPLALHAQQNIRTTVILTLEDEVCYGVQHAIAYEGEGMTPARLYGKVLKREDCSKFSSLLPFSSVYTLNEESCIIAAKLHSSRRYVLGKAMSCEKLAKIFIKGQ